jgi:hypothetical protein
MLFSYSLLLKKLNDVTFFDAKTSFLNTKTLKRIPELVNRIEIGWKWGKIGVTC